MEQKEKSSQLFRSVVLVGIVALMMVSVSNLVLGNDAVYFLKWYFTLFLLGISFLPFTVILFPTFKNKGYLFSKVIAIVIAAMTLWALSSLHILKFTRGNTIIAVVLVVIIEVLLLYFINKKKEKKFYAFFKDNESLYIKRFLMIEIFFFIVFLAFLYLRSFRPEAYGTEKFMDFGFMTMMMKTDFFPPNDIWFTGKDLNYYYLGQYFATYITKLSGNTVAYGYNLALMMIGAFCFCFSFEIGKEISYLVSKKGKKDGRIATITGLIAAFAVTIAGNMHYVLFYRIVPWIQQILEIEESSYWYADSTRYIGYHPDLPDKTIHEFPAYSFILGDLHAHVIDIMFVLVFLAILVSYVAIRKKRMVSARLGNVIEFDTRKEILSVHIIFLGFLLGIFYMTNFWDFPIYLTVAILLLVFVNLVETGFKISFLRITIMQAAIMIIVSQLTSFIFQMKFIAMVNGIGVCENHTQLYQWIILWGLPVLIIIGFFISQAIKAGKREESYHKNRLASFILGLEPADLLVIVLGFCGIGLILIPELIYVRDIYEGTYSRTNTMFKLTYEAFILFGISMSYIISKWIFRPEKQVHRKRGIIALVFLLCTCCYFVSASKMRFGEFTSENRDGLDASTFLRTELADDVDGIYWLNQNVEEAVVVLEADGKSYTLYNRVSAFTGLPTILGWETHEHLWQNDYSVVAARSAEVRTVYTETDMELVKDVLTKYEVAYIFVGQMEYEKYEDINVDGIMLLGDMVYINNNTESGKPTMIIQVNQ